MTSSEPWTKELLERLRAIVFRQGVDEVASKIPADRATLYRIINGHTRRPQLAVRARIVELVEEDEEEPKP